MQKKIPRHCLREWFGIKFYTNKVVTGLWVVRHEEVDNLFDRWIFLNWRQNWYYYESDRQGYHDNQVYGEEELSKSSLL